MLEERSEQLYRDISEAQRERLRAFWWAHPYRTLTLDGVDWRYLEGGEGQRLLLLLPGGHLPAQFWFAVMDEFERECRVVALDAPARCGVLDARVTVQALARLIEAQGVFGAAIVAHGEAGLAAQLLLREYPHRVQALALISSPWLDARAGHDTAARLTRWAAARLPWRLTQPMLAHLAPRELPADSPWTPYARALLNCPSVLAPREATLALQRATWAMQRGAPPRAAGPAGWRGRCLVVSASDDWRTAREAAALTASLPNARAHWFTEGGQATPLLYPEALCRELRLLLAEAALPLVGLDAAYLRGADAP
jgi:pimeloyl-ACP methyl ester carboxylesterase